MDTTAFRKKEISLKPVSFSSGVPNRYEVLGLPQGETAEIMLKLVRGKEKWKVRVGATGRFRGTYKSSEDALLALLTGRLPRSQQVNNE